MKVGLVTDSNSQLPPDLAKALGVEVVALPVTVGDRPHREGVDLDPDDFYEQLTAGEAVTTSQPSPGELAGAYGRLLERGCDRIVSVHVGGDYSGTVNSARLAAELVPAPVDVVDSGQASFSLGLAVMAAAEARSAGAHHDEMISAAQWVVDRVRNVFVMDGVALARASGRVDVTDLEHYEDRPEIPVMTFEHGELVIVGVAGDLAEAAVIMFDAVAEDADGPIRAGVGVAHRSLFSFYDEFDDAVAVRSNIEVVRYRCGPTVGAFTGAGTMGACWVPLRA